jgi:hypothetical protein
LSLLLMSGYRWDRSNTFYPPQIGCPPNPLQAVEKQTGFLRSSFDAERHEMSVSVDRLAVLVVVFGIHQPHVLAGQIV